MRLKFSLNLQRIRRRLKRKKTQVGLAVAILLIVLCMFALAVTPLKVEDTICQGNGTLTESNLRVYDHAKHCTDVHITIDHIPYDISWEYSEKDPLTLRKTLQSIENQMVEFQYLQAAPGSRPTILEFCSGGTEYVSLETTYSNIIKNRIWTPIIAWILLLGSSVYILFELRILRFIPKRTKKRRPQHSSCN